MNKRIASLSLAAVLALGAASALADYTPGEYTASAQGFGGAVTVNMTFDGTSITDVAVEAASETAGIGTNAIEKLPGAILAAQSAEVDAVAGATFTSKAILAAARDCINQASGNTAAAEVKMAPGTYVGQGLGFRISEPLTVSVTVDETSIKEIVVDQVNTSEKPYILKTVVERMIPRMIENQSISVDAICGATASSNGVRQAVEAALTEALVAGGSDASAITAFYNVPAKKDACIDLNTQVLVVGMGGSGTASAISAAAQGLNVLAVDKAAKWGGTSVLTSGPMAINVPSQVAKEITDWVDPISKEKRVKAAGENLIDAEALYADWLAYTTYEGRQMAKPEMIRLMMDESGYTDDWLAEYGFSFETASTFAGNSWPAFTPITGAKALTEDFYAEAYAIYTEKLGGSYMLETECYDLLWNDDHSKVVGAKAVNLADGTQYVIHADAVILATGGYAGSAEMEEKYLSDEYFPLKGSWKMFGMQQNDGKMIQAAIDGGAGTYNIGVAPMVHVGGVDGFLPGHELVPVEGKMGTATGRPAVWSEGDTPLNMAISSNTLAVGADARRFTSETALSMFNPWISGPHFYTIYGNDQVQKLIANGFDEVPFGPSTSYLGYGTSIPAGVALPNTEAILEEAISAGFVFKADTIEELAEKMGLDAATLAATVEQYNAYCAAGVDESFGKDAKYLVSVTGTPYYGIVGSSYCYSTCGGLDINTRMQVLKPDGQTAIDGLYAVGTDSCGVLFSEAKAYVTYGGAAQGWAYTSGRLVGGYVAEDLAK